jgi:hypothetical protein
MLHSLSKLEILPELQVKITDYNPLDKDFWVQIESWEEPV